MVQEIGASVPRYLNDGILSDVVTLQQLYQFRASTGCLLGGVLIHATGSTLSVTLFLVLFSIASHRLRASLITVFMAVAILCAVLSAGCSVAVIWLRMGIELDARPDLAYMKKLSVVTYVTTALACLLTDTTLIPRILLWFPREDPSTYRRGLMLVALPIAIKVLRVAFTILGAHMVYHLDGASPIVISLEPYCFFLAFIDEAYATLILCYKLVGVGWKRHRRGKNQHLDNMVKVVRRTVFLSVASFAVPSALTMVAFILQETGVPYARFKMWCVTLHMYCLIAGASFTCLWPVIKADKIKEKRNGEPESRKLVCSFDADMDRDLNDGLSLPLNARGASAGEERKKHADRNPFPSNNDCKLKIRKSVNLMTSSLSPQGVSRIQKDSPLSASSVFTEFRSQSLDARLRQSRLEVAHSFHGDYFNFQDPACKDMEAAKQSAKRHFSWNRPGSIRCANSISNSPGEDGFPSSSSLSGPADLGPFGRISRPRLRLTPPQQARTKSLVTDAPAPIPEVCEILYERLAASAAVNGSGSGRLLSSHCSAPDVQQRHRCHSTASIISGEARHKTRSADSGSAQDDDATHIIEPCQHGNSPPFSTWVGDRTYRDAYDQHLGAPSTSDVLHARKSSDTSACSLRFKACNDSPPLRCGWTRLVRREQDSCCRLSSRGMASVSHGEASTGAITFETETQVSIS